MKRREPIGRPRARPSRPTRRARAQPGRRRWPAALAAAAATAGLLATARRLVLRVAGPSMLPLVAPGDLVITWPSRGRALRVGDVVVLTDPAGRQVVKRVSAIAGGWADVMDGPVAVPPGHLAVTGDNQAASTDSRHYGPVAVEAVAGRVVVVVGSRPPFLRRPDAG